MAQKQIIRITLDVEIEKDVEELPTKVAGRAYTIQGVTNALVVAFEDLSAQGLEFQTEAVDFMKERAPTLWERIKGWFK
jgi:hypothetical protein